VAVADDLDRALAAAGLGLLQANDQLTVYDSTVPNGVLSAGVPAPPFVLVYTQLSRPADSLAGADTIEGRQMTWTVSWYCHCAGATGDAARTVAQQVRASLLGAHPAVAGFASESVGLISEVASQPAGRDESLGFPVITTVRVFELLASA
jgi:hypothetical protein